MARMISYATIARRHGHVFRMALQNEGDWRMDTWQRARQGELSCLHTPIPELCNAILNTCQMPSPFYIIPSNVNKRQTHLLKPFLARDLVEGHICRQNTLMFALVFCFELRARAARTYCHCHLGCEKSNSWRQARSVKAAKKSWTVPQCGHVTLNCVQMASKQPNVEFSSHIYQFTRLHGVAVMQGLTFRDSVVTLFNQPGGTYCQAQDFLLRTNHTLEMWCANTKSANQVPTSPVKTLVIPMSWSYRCFEWQEG